METKPKFTNSPANDFSTFAKRIQGKSKEEQEKIRTELRTARYSSAKLTGISQEMNIKNQMFIEQGANPTDVLWWNASTLAMKAKETNNLRYLDLIPKIETKHGNYAQTMKGRKLIYDTRKEILASLNSENNSDRSYLEFQRKEDERAFRIKANRAYYDFKMATKDGMENAKTVWETIQKDAIEGGYDTILKSVVSNMDTTLTAKPGMVKKLEDHELFDKTNDLLEDDTVLTIELSDSPENIFDSIVYHLIKEEHYDISESQQTLIKNHIKTITSSEKIDFFTQAKTDGTEVIKNFFNEASMKNGVADLFKSSEVMQVEQDAIRELNENRQRIWIKYLNLAKGEDGEYKGYQDWDSELQKKFKTEVTELNKDIIKDYRDTIFNAYEKYKGTERPETAQQELDRALSDRFTLEQAVRWEMIPTKLINGKKLKSLKEVKDELNNINFWIEKRHPSVWNNALEDADKIKERATKVSIITPTPDQEGIVEGLMKIVEEVSPEKPEVLNTEINKYLRGKQKTLDSDSKAMIKDIADTLVDYSKIPDLKKYMDQLSMKVSGEFPRWILGALDPQSWKLQTTRATSNMSQKEISNVIALQNKVHKIIQEEAIAHSIKFKKGYKGFKTVKDGKLEGSEIDQFQKAVKTRMDAIMSPDKINALQDATKDKTSDTSPNKKMEDIANRMFKSKNQTMDYGVLQDPTKMLLLVDSLDETTLNTIFNDLGLEITEDTPDQKSAIGTYIANQMKF